MGELRGGRWPAPTDTAALLCSDSEGHRWQMSFFATVEEAVKAAQLGRCPTESAECCGTHRIAARPQGQWLVFTVPPKKGHNP
ncbi:hypothetical protein [Mycolicibacterium hippocampi]|uniref:Uncharacterized protein n=1 Tax=Mycolicibacterium hippocampi TaxID=659824 RepID=A0A7I9ZQU4_9MYCO|nr:hypothetical protein [Mycolicibacterium hippocampi]GFH03384.1 hypothetical protein MHIP_38670 [Mycolicibacterium hippocampi]